MEVDFYMSKSISTHTPLARRDGAPGGLAGGISNFYSHASRKA